MPIPTAPQTTPLEEFEKDRDRVGGMLERVRAEIEGIENGSTLSELRAREEKIEKMLAVTTERLITAGGIAETVTSAVVQLEFDFEGTPTVPYEPIPQRAEVVPMPQVLAAAGV